MCLTADKYTLMVPWETLDAAKWAVNSIRAHSEVWIGLILGYAEVDVVAGQLRRSVCLTLPGGFVGAYGLC